jgi:glutaminase
LLFAGAEEVLRTIERQRARFEVAILEVSRIDDINDSARRMLAGMRATLSAVGKEGYLVDPDGEVVRTGGEQDYDAIVFSSVDDAVVAAVRRLT